MMNIGIIFSRISVGVVIVNVIITFFILIQLTDHDKD